MRTNDELVHHLQDVGVLHSPQLIAAFKAIDRADFVLPEYRDEAYLDTALPIGHGQTISQPYTVAFMLELLDPQPGDRILDVGCGSGYQTALLAHAVTQEGNKGRVIGVELIPELANLAEQNVGRYSFLDREICKILNQNAELGLPESAPFDGIIGAASTDIVPHPWKRQLKIGGRIVLPVGSDVVRLEKVDQDEFDEERYPGFAFVPFVQSQQHQ